jgi:hypothetical protein
MANQFIQPIAPSSPMTSVIAPDLMSQQAQLQRQQQMADLLRQQSLTPMDQTQVIGDRAIKQSPIMGLSKIFDGLAAHSMQGDLDQKQSDLNVQMGQRMADQLRKVYFGDNAGQNSSAPAAQPSGDSAPPLQLINGALQSAPTQQVANPVPATPAQPTGDPRRAAALAAALSGNNQLASNLMENVLDKTDFGKDADGLPVGMKTAAYENKLLPTQTAQALAAGLDPSAANAAALAKANYIAPIDAKMGTPLLDPLTHALIAYAPKASEGINLNFKTDGNGQTVATSANQIPNYSAANAAIQGAEQGAKQANTIFTGIPNPMGGTSSGFGGALVGGGSPGAGVPGGSNLAAPGSAPTIPMSRPGILSSPSATDAAVQKASADEFAQLPQVVQQAKGSISGLESALRQSNLVNASGAGTAKTNDVIAAFNNATGAKISGDSNTSYQLLHKYLANSLQQAAQGTGATGSDARMEGFSAGQPNADTMSLPALQGAIRYVLGQNDAAAAGAQFKQDAYAKEAANGNPNAAQAAKSQWSQVYKPDNFNFNRMSQDEQMSFLKSQGANAPAWIAQYKQYAQDHPGWVK